MNIEELVIDISDARYIGDYRLEIIFSDGARRVVDFGPFLMHSSHPDVRKYLDKKKFEDITIENGDIMWNDYELCFPVADLYDGII
jgi:hypothetical protein